MYVEDILSTSTNETNILKSLEGDIVKYNDCKIATLDIYLGSNI